VPQLGIAGADNRANHAVAFAQDIEFAFPIHAEGNVGAAPEITA
jgi:hypothetical protein